MQNYQNGNGRIPERRVPNSRKKRGGKGSSALLVLLLVLAVVIITVLVISGKSNIKKPDQSAEFEVKVPDTLTTKNTEPPATTVGVPSFLTDSATTTTAATEPPAPITPTTPETGNNETKYPYTYKIAQSEAVGDSFFDDAVFIGDSRMKGMMLFGTIKCDWYATESLHISSVDTKKFYTVGTTDYTAIEMLRMNADKYKKIYIGLGINDLGYTPATFIAHYRDIIGKIKEISPDADIYVMAVLPVSKARSDQAIYGVTNDKVGQFNQALSSMAEGMDKVYMLDVAEPFWSANGSLIDGTGSNDGVHLGADGYKIECDYIRTHTVK